VAGDIRIPNKNLRFCIGELLNLKFNVLVQVVNYMEKNLIIRYLKSKLIIFEPPSNFWIYADRNFLWPASASVALPWYACVSIYYG